MLAGDPPDNVRQKLLKWGVSDYAAVFVRASGWNSVFPEPPKFDLLTDHFLGSYHHYGDARFGCFMEFEPFRKISTANFRSELYASGKYPRLARTTMGRLVVSCPALRASFVGQA